MGWAASERGLPALSLSLTHLLGSQRGGPHPESYARSVSSACCAVSTMGTHYKHS